VYTLTFNFESLSDRYLDNTKNQYNYAYQMGNETSCCSNGKSRRQNRLQNRLVAQQKAAASAASKSGESEDAMQILLKKKMREISNPSSNRHRNRSSSPALRGGKDKKEINGCECGKICMCAYLERVQKRSASRKG